MTTLDRSITITERHRTRLLGQISAMLGVSVAELYQPSKPEPNGLSHELTDEHEALQLGRLWLSIKNPVIRAQIATFIRSVADES